MNDKVSMETADPMAADTRLDRLPAWLVRDLEAIRRGLMLAEVHYDDNGDVVTEDAISEAQQSLNRIEERLIGGEVINGN
jgi:hypothetical protein